MQKSLNRNREVRKDALSYFAGHLRWAKHFSPTSWVFAAILAMVQIGCGGKGGDSDALPSVDAATLDVVASDAGASRIDARADSGPDAEGGQAVVDASSTRDALPPDTLVSLSLVPNGRVIAPDEKVVLNLIGTYSNRLTLDLTLQATFVSSNIGVAVVNTGIVRGVSKGTAIITASYGGLTASSTITVDIRTVVSLTPSATTIYGKVGQGFGQIKVTAVYSDMTKDDVTKQVAWTSSDTGVVWVSPDDGIGPIEYVGPGTATLQGTYGGLTVTVTVTVSGPTVLGYSIMGAKPVMRVGESGHLELWIQYAGSEPRPSKSVFWQSSNPAIVSVSADGNTFGLAIGTSIVSAMSGDKVVASVTIAVKNTALTSIAISPSPVEVIFPGLSPVTATGTYADGTMFDITSVANWSSVEGLSTAVTDKLRVGGTALGTFQLTVELDGIKASGPVVVKVGTPLAIDLGGDQTFPPGVPSPLGVLATYADGNQLYIPQAITWSVVDPTVATVDANGFVRGLKPGTTLVQGAFPGVTIAPIAITISTAVLLTIDLAPSNLFISLGNEPIGFQATGIFDDGATYDVSAGAVWKIGNPLIATVSNVGNQTYVTPLKAGTTVVSATVGTVTGSTTITVTPP